MLSTLATTTLPALVICCLVGATAQAASLRPEKATDASVCDLGPNTNSLLSRRVLVAAEGSPKDQAETYFRLGATFVSSKCSNGQLLIVHGQSESRVDIASLEQLVNSSCVSAGVQRSDVPYTYTGRTRPGFELRCLISKHAELTSILAERERTEPLETIVARMAGGAAPAAASGQPTSDNKDCGKMTLSSVLGGGNCR